MNSRGSRAGVLLLICAGCLATTASAQRAEDDEQAEGFSWLRSRNDNVQEGNELFAKGDAKQALAAYERAARELPAEAGVHLNRGLSLLATGEVDKAREAFLLATQPPARDDVRADARCRL